MFQQDISTGDDQKQKNDEAIDKLKRKRSDKKSIITMKMTIITIR